MEQWLSTGASLTGLTHQMNNTPCQDSVAIMAEPDKPYWIAAVADGVGSLQHSQMAAAEATQAAQDWLSRNSAYLASGIGSIQSEEQRQKLEQEFGAALLKLIVGRIRSAADRAELSVADMDCNLAFVWVNRRLGRAIWGHLGDCAVMVLGQGEASQVYSARSGSANATATVLSPNAAAELHVHIAASLEGIEGFVLCTDGLEGELYRKNSRRPLQRAGEYYNTLFVQGMAEGMPRHILALRKKLRWLQQHQGERFDDDISIAALSLTGRPVELPEDLSWKCSCTMRNPMTSFFCRNCGTEFVSLYPRELLEHHGGLDETIAYFTAHRAAENAQLGLPEDAGDLVFAEPAPAPEAAQETPEPPRQQEREKQSPAHTFDSRGNHARIRSGGVVHQFQERVAPEPVIRLEEKPGEEVPSRRPSFLSRGDRGFLIGILAFLLLALAVTLFYLGIVKNLLGTAPTEPSTGPSLLESYLPEGYRITHEGGYFVIGRYESGLRHGLFLKVPESQPHLQFVVEYEYGRLVEEVPGTDVPPAGTTEPQPPAWKEDIVYRVTQDTALFAEPAGSPGEMQLREGDVVTAVRGSFFRTEAALWFEVVCQDGTRGWVQDLYLVQITSDHE